VTYKITYDLPLCICLLTTVLSSGA